MNLKFLRKKNNQRKCFILRLFYSRYILEYPRIIFLLVLLVIGFFGYQARKLEVDASAETLLLEDDKDLKYTRLVNERYGSQDFLFITYNPKEDLLSSKSLENLRKLKIDLEKLEIVDSVISILNVPLLQSPPKPVKELLKNVPTLESPDIDKELAKIEFLNSPVYQNMLVSQDFQTTALLVNLCEDLKFKDLLNQRNHLRQKEKDKVITPEESDELEKVIKSFKIHRDKARIEDHKNLIEVRRLIDQYRGDATIFLGGPRMIVDDLIGFLKNDLKFFGAGVLLFLMIMLWVIFRQLRWILLPIVCCAFSVIATTGILGMFSWEVTVISSNFISIQLIITMAITIHLIVRYRELQIKNPEASQKDLALDSVVSMSSPCFYAALTTIAGFCSLILSDILPVINFGWMMSAGIAISLILTFLLFPLVVIQMKIVPPKKSFNSGFSLTEIFAKFTEKRGRSILVISVLVFLFSLLGTSKLIVENSFIDYFKDSSEIYKGLKIIDQELGGTTPLDVIIDLEEEKKTPVSNAERDENTEEEDEDFAELDDEFEQFKGEAQYWFTTDKMELVEKIHDYLDSMPETGKILSLGTMLKVGKTLNDGKPLDNFALALIYKELPERFRKIVLSPFVSVENNQVRFSIRIRDTEPDLRRNELLKKIRSGLINDIGLSANQIHLASFLVLYNNMLQSLFDSQILTLGAVLIALMIMFWILFRSLKIAMIAIFPNVLSVGFVLGFMGWIGIPLDMMTITIASISVGIAVDDTIHYIHRFIKEFALDQNYVATMHRSHKSIGSAMYYTSVTIIIGFSILVTSDFIPSIYFGLLTGLAMAIALVAALSLLPQLLILIKPLGPEKSPKSPSVT